MALKKERIRKLADFIEKNVTVKQFDMETWLENPKLVLGSNTPPEVINHCGTVGCLAGWAVLLFAPKTKPLHTVLGIHEEETHIGGAYLSEVAEELLGLDYYNAELFGEVGYNKKQAVAALRRLADTGYYSDEAKEAAETGETGETWDA